VGCAGGLDTTCGRAGASAFRASGTATDGCGLLISCGIHGVGRVCGGVVGCGCVCDRLISCGIRDIGCTG
jgi:hypothetical protein